MRQVRNVASVLLVMVLLAGMSQGQETAYYEQGGVEYYMVVGEVGTGTLTYGADPPEVLPFDGCVVAKLRPGTTNGRIRVLSVIDGVEVGFNMNRFSDPGVLPDIQVDGHGPNGTITNPDVVATIAGQGRATMDVGGRPYSDPVTDDPFLSGLFFVTDHGFRHDETGQITDPAPVEEPEDADWEAHFRFASFYGGSAEPLVSEHQVPPNDGLLPEYMPPAEEYATTYGFPNLRFGGQADLVLEASSIAHEGTELTFTLRSANGTILETFHAAPTLGQPFEDSFTFSLDRFGDYTVEVRGAVNMAEYRVELTQRPAATFALDFWWDELAFGSDAPVAQEHCTETLYGDQSPSGVVSDLPPPPGWPWHAVVLTVLGAIATVLVLVKVSMMAHAISKHREMARR